MFRSKYFRVPAFSIAIAANIILGTNAVATKIAVEHGMDPLFYAAVRALLIGLALLFLIKHFQFLARLKPMLHLVFSAVLVAGFISFFSVGVELSTALKASLLSLTTPVSVYALSVFILGEPVIKRALAGGGVALAGGLLLVGLPLILGEAFVFGDMLLFIAYFLLAASIIHAKYLFKWVEPVAVISIRFLLAGAAILPLVLLWNGHEVAIGVTAVAWAALAYTVVIPGAIGLSLYYNSLRRIKGEDAAPLFYLDPMTGILAAGILLGEQLDMTALIGAVIIIIGVMIAHPHHGQTFHRHHVHVPHIPEDVRRGWSYLKHKL